MLMVMKELKLKMGRLIAAGLAAVMISGTASFGGIQAFAAETKAEASTSVSSSTKKSAGESDASGAVDFSYVEKDIANWNAVYLPVLSAKGTLGARGKLPERQSKNLDVTDAIEDIYANLTATRKISSVLKTEKALILYDVLNGNYSRKAVEALLDHGYFTDYYQNLHKAGLVEEDYRLPERCYSIEVLDETVTVPQDGGEDMVYRMIRTDSDALDMEQLLTVAKSTNDKKTVRSLEKKIASFEDDFVPKYEED